MKTSTHVRALATVVIVAFIGSMMQNATVTTWFHAHPWYDAIATATGVAYAAYVSYANQQPQSAA